MNREKFEEIMDEYTSYEYIEDDTTFLGLQLIRKYLPKKGIEGAEHDVLFSANVSELVDAGITEENVRELKRLGWHIHDNEYMAIFV